MKSDKLRLRENVVTRELKRDYRSFDVHMAPMPNHEEKGFLMFPRISQIFSPPVFEDEEQTRVAGLLNAILFGTLGVTLAVIFLQPLYSPDPAPRLLFIAMFALLEVGGLLMIRRGRVSAVVNLLPAAMWLLLTAITFVSGGVRTTSFISYTIVIVIASLLGGGRVGIGYAAISVLAGLGFLLGELNGLLPAAVIPTTPVSVWVGLAANFLIAGLLLHLTTSSITAALDRARRNEADLQERNLQLYGQAQALEANEARYRGIVEDQTEMIVRWQPDGTRTFVNASYCRYYNQPSEALVGTSFFPLVVDDDQAQIQQKIAALTPDSPAALDEHRSITPSGEISWQQWTDRGIFDAAGNLVEIQSVGRDITFQKLAEEALQRSANRLGTLHAIDQAILAAESADEIVEATLQNLRDLIPGEQFSVSLFNFENEMLQLIRPMEEKDAGRQTDQGLSVDSGLPFDRLQQGEIYPIIDPATGEPSPPARRILGGAAIKSGFMTPILSKDGLVGTINMASQSPDAFSQEHLEIAQEVANSLGVALQTAGLVTSLQRSSSQLETLRRASLQLTSDLTLQPVLSGVLEYALTLTAADDAHIFLYDETKNHLTFGAAHWAGDRQEQPYAELRPEGLTYTVAHSGQRIVAPEVNSHPLFKDWPWGGAIIGLPLHHGKRVNGVMTVAFDQPHDFPEDEIRILELLADQAAIAIQNAQLFAREHRQTQRLEALIRVGLALSIDLDLDSLLFFIVQQAIDLLGATAGGMYLHNPEEDLLVWQVRSGDNLAPLGSTLKKGEGVSGLVWETGQLVNIRDYEAWSRKTPAYKTFTWQSVLGVPVSRGDQFFGVLNILADRTDAFSDSDANLLSLFAAQTAIAIENARLFQSVSEQGVQLRDLTTQLASLEEEERKQLARELHDRVGQNLTALSINLSMAKSLLPENAADLASRLDDSQRLVAETAEHIRDVMADLRPPVLDDYGLLAALRWYCDRYSGRTGIQVKLEGQEINPRLPLTAESALFRIAQEALTNISRHAGAQSVQVSLGSAATSVQLTVADQGTGFDPLTPENTNGWGLRIMRERAESVNGELAIDSTPGQGTRIRVQLPR